jgi:hypothetical protein
MSKRQYLDFKTHGSDGQIAEGTQHVAHPRIIDMDIGLFTGASIYTFF